MLRCRLFGHQPQFTADAEVMRWQCARGCGWHGAKSYATVDDARRYARALNRQDRDDLGRRAPFIALLPLRVLRAVRARRSRPQ